MVSKAFIFDLDGTILFLGVDWNRVRIRLIEFYSTCGLEFELSDILNIFKSIDRAENLLKSQVVPDEFRKKAFDIIKDEEIKGAPNSHFRESADELLSFLKGQTLAIVSSNSRAAAEIAFKITGIDTAIFKSIIMRDDVDNLKPDPQGIIKAIKQLRERDEKLREFYYIGDQKNDVIAAKKAGEILEKDGIQIKTIALGGGASKEEKIKAQNPDFFTKHVKEVQEIIRGLLSE